MIFHCFRQDPSCRHTTETKQTQSRIDRFGQAVTCECFRPCVNSGGLLPKHVLCLHVLRMLWAESCFQSQLISAFQRISKGCIHRFVTWTYTDNRDVYIVIIMWVTIFTFKHTEECVRWQQSIIYKQCLCILNRVRCTHTLSADRNAPLKHWNYCEHQKWYHTWTNDLTNCIHSQS